MHAYIIQQLIRIILFITISLPIGLKSFAQETKRFYMELDTPRNGAKAGQELELKYISTADFDSVSPPDFGTLIETVEGVTPLKANGKEYETPLTSVWVHPVDTNIDSVKCSIQLEGSYRKGVFTAIVICLLIAWLLIRLSFQKQKK